MTNNNSSSYSGGVGFLGMLTILFIGLKLGNVIQWNWFWVLSPVLIPVSIITLLICICISVVLFVRK